MGELEPSVGEPGAAPAGAWLSRATYVTSLLFIIYVFNQIDRAVIGVVIDLIKADFQVSDTQLGFLLGPAMILFYVALGLPIASLGDRFNRVWLMSFAIIVWSSFTVYAGFVGSFTELIISRVGVGVGEAGFAALAQSLIVDSGNKDTQRQRITAFMMALPVAGVLSVFAGGWIAELWGWRAAFIAVGLPGFLLAPLLFATVRDPRHAGGSQVERLASEGYGLRAGWLFILGSKPLRWLLIGQAISNAAITGVGNWSIAYLVRTFSLSYSDIANNVSVVNLANCVVTISLYSYLSRTPLFLNIARSLKIMAIVAALAPAGVICFLLSPNLTIALILLLLMGIPLSFFLVPTNIIIQALAPDRARASISSIFISVQVFGALLSIQLVGILSDLLAGDPSNSAGSLRGSLLLICPLSTIAALAYWRAAVAVRSERSAFGLIHKVGGQE